MRREQESEGEQVKSDEVRQGTRKTRTQTQTNEWVTMSTLRGRMGREWQVGWDEVCYIGRSLVQGLDIGYSLMVVRGRVEAMSGPHHIQRAACR